MRSETDKGTPLSAHVAQPRDGDELHRRQVLQVRHAAVPEDRHLRQSQLQRASARRSRTPLPTWPARIKSYTADRLTYSPDPPACYGMIEFEEGGRVMIDFTDIDADALEGRPAHADDVPHQGHRHRAAASAATTGKPRPSRPKPKA